MIFCGFYTFHTSESMSAKIHKWLEEAADPNIKIWPDSEPDSSPLSEDAITIDPLRKVIYFVCVEL